MKTPFFETRNWGAGGEPEAPIAVRPKLVRAAAFSVLQVTFRHVRHPERQSRNQPLTPLRMT
jgi:hypothetical protein